MPTPGRDAQPIPSAPVGAGEYHDGPPPRFQGEGMSLVGMDPGGWGWRPAPGYLPPSLRDRAGSWSQAAQSAGHRRLASTQPPALIQMPARGLLHPLLPQTCQAQHGQAQQQPGRGGVRHARWPRHERISLGIWSDRGGLYPDP